MTLYDSLYKINDLETNTKQDNVQSKGSSARGSHSVAVNQRFRYSKADNKWALNDRCLACQNYDNQSSY